jgi:type IV pilus assembly protein PilY1
LGFADFLTAGERVTVNMAQANGFLGVATNIPQPTACNPGGKSWLYVIEVQEAVATDSTFIESMAAGVNMVALPSGVRFMHVNVNGQVTLSATLSSPSTNPGLRRTSWRELIQGR